MNTKPYIPTPLQIVAGLFLLWGISSVIGMLVRLAGGSSFMDLGFLGIPTFFGLRRFSRGWRIYALVCTWIGMLGAPAMFFLGISGRVPAYFDLAGIHVARIAPGVLAAAMVPIFLLEVWQYKVLTHPGIRALFYRRDVVEEEA